MKTLLEHLPVKLKERVFLEDGKLHVSTELKGNPDLLSFIGFAQRHGITETVWSVPREFDLLYSRHDTSTDVESLRSASDVQNYARNLFQSAYEANASDIHIMDFGPYGLIQIRCLGLIKDFTELRGEKARRLIAGIYQTMCQAADAQFSPSIRQDARIAGREYLPASVHSIRVHTEPLQSSLAADGCGIFMGLRLLYDRTRAAGSLEERVATLGFDPKDAERFRFLTRRTGLTIISGPTGSGKSTLLKHIMEGQTASNPEKSYFSIEDPTEFSMEYVKQTRVSTSAHSSLSWSDTQARSAVYTEAIGGAMRSDPDVIMIGEIRYPETAAASIDAALTGHGVWATLHANNAFGIIRRMVSLLNAANYAEPVEYLCDANVMAGLVYQRLLPVLCPECKISLQKFLTTTENNSEIRQKVLPDAVLARLLSVTDDIDEIYVRSIDGCTRCRNQGIVGQTVAAEVVVCDQILLSHLRNGQYENAQIYWKSQGGRTYVEHAINLITQGTVDPYYAELRLGVPLNFSKVFEEFKGKSA